MDIPIWGVSTKHDSLKFQHLFEDRRCLVKSWQICWGFKGLLTGDLNFCWCSSFATQPDDECRFGVESAPGFHNVDVASGFQDVSSFIILNWSSNNFWHFLKKKMRLEKKHMFLWLRPKAAKTKRSFCHTWTTWSSFWHIIADPPTCWATYGHQRPSVLGLPHGKKHRNDQGWRPC